MQNNLHDDKHECDTENTHNDDRAKRVLERIEEMRPRLLDFSTKNPLISTKFTSRGSRNIRVIDELPDILLYKISNSDQLRFSPLPDLEEDPKDENTDEFQDALSNARLTDPHYQESLKQIDEDGSDPDEVRKIERELRDKVREALKMPARPKSRKSSLTQHALNHHINPSFDLPLLESEDHPDKHIDSDIQTLLLPEDLDSKLRKILSKSNTWLQETGIGVLYGAFGFLKIKEANQAKPYMSPLILCPVHITKRKSYQGNHYFVKSTGEEPLLNPVLKEKMKFDFGIELPDFDGFSVETFLKELGKIKPKGLNWHVCRQVAFGIFPSARVSMYYDLDTNRKDFELNNIAINLLGGVSQGDITPFAEEYNVDHPNIEENVPYLVSDADSSQFSALVDIASGMNLALEGPPGTGKSQTIVNAIANAIGTGKKVLFVAQKSAALDVVKNRLDALGLGDFVLALLARSSTRESVIQSLRERIELTSNPNPKDLSQKINEYKRNREELAAYIDALSSNYGDTGWTVHQVLGKAIAKTSLLDPLPGEIKTRKIAAPGKYNSIRINHLKERGKQFTIAWNNAQQASQYWQRINCGQVNKFLAEDICTLASQASDCFREAADLIATLTSCGIDSARNINDIESYIETSNLIKSCLKSLDANILNSLRDEKTLNWLENYHVQWTALTQQKEQLAHYLIGIEEHDWLKYLSSLERIATEYEIDTIDITALKTKHDNKSASIDSYRDVFDYCSNFLQAAPELIDYPLTKLAKAKQIVNCFRRDILSCRNSNNSSEEGITFLKHGIAQLSHLRGQLEQLSVIINHETNTNLQDLNNHITNLQNSGPLARIFSSKYRSAKRFYRTLSKRPHFHLSIAIEDLQKLYRWQKSVEDLQHDKHNTMVFGPLFNGIDTNIELYQSLVQYYEQIDSELSGLQNRKLRAFLKSAAIELLEALPEPCTPQWIGSFPELEAYLQTETKTNQRLHHAIEQLEFHNKSISQPLKVNFVELTSLIKQVKDYQGKKQELYNDFNPPSNLISHEEGFFQDANTIQNHCNIARRLLSHNISKPYESWLNEENLATVIETLNQVRRSLQKSNEYLSELYEKAQMSSFPFEDEKDLSSKAIYLASAAQDKHGLIKYSELVRARESLEEDEFMWVASILLEKDHNILNLDEILEGLIIRSMVNDIDYQYNGIISKYSGSDLDQLRLNLIELDKNLISLYSKNLRNRLEHLASPPQGNNLGKKSEWTELELIYNEISRKKKFVSVRELVKRASGSMRELKPCWMASPLALAQYLPKDLKFDLCIIDEASQMPPEDAIGAIMRSRQAVIVGDTEQLPPTSFFKKILDDEDEEEDDGETISHESILELAKAVFRPSRRLRWHYRSRHSALIKFSNQNIYQNNLVVFPSPTENREDMGLQHRFIKGQYRAGTNPIEAKEVVKAALRFMRQEPTRSLGIVTLNQKQRELIETELDQALVSMPTAHRYIENWLTKNHGLEPFFIKNLENVQGDERDVIFISTVYGPESIDGPVMQRFGPVSGTTGKRRLNVLFTRAKEQIVTFTSLKASDIKATKESNEGAHLLKCWLEYSSTGNIDPGKITNREPDSEFEIYVMDQIRAMGCEPVPQVGVAGYFIDIAVKHPHWPHGYLMAVECDGATYHSAKSARDRDRLRQEVLENLGWHVYRIWSTDWFNDPILSRQNLGAAIERRLEALKTANVETSPPLVNTTVKEQENENQYLNSSPCDSKMSQYQENSAHSDNIPTSRESGSGHAAKLNLIDVGDRVRIQYLTGNKSTLEFTLTERRNEPDQGFVGSQTPLGQALIGSSVEDEVEVLVGSIIKRAVIEHVIKGYLYESKESAG